MAPKGLSRELGGVVSFGAYHFSVPPFLIPFCLWDCNRFGPVQAVLFQ